MKNYEKEVKRLLSDKMLRPDDSFKRSLRKDVMNKAQNKTAKSPWWIIPALGTGLIAIAIVGMQLWSTGNPDSIIKNPFQPPTVSAKELIRKITSTPSNLGESGKSFAVYKTYGVIGPQYGWCDREGMGDRIASIDAYVFNAADSGREAMYIKLTHDSGDVTETQYYNADSEELKVWSAGFASGDFLESDTYDVGGEPYYLVVDKNGNELKDDTLSQQSQNGRSTYEFIIKENTAVTGNTGSTELSPNGKPWCDPREILTKVTVDATTNRVIGMTEYKGTVTPENVAIDYRYDLQLQDLDEERALKIMADAGYRKAEASSSTDMGNKQQR